MKPYHLALALAVVLAAPATAKPAGPDLAFMKTAAEAGMAEVAAGQAASTMAKDADVKSFAQQMVTDHTKANDELMSLAAKLKVGLPKKTDAKHAALLKKLQKMKGDAFDKAYVKAQVEDHKKAVDLFTRESAKGKDAEVKAWATATLPTLKHHLEMVQDLQKKMK
jgi:putative membrane protein